MFSIFLFFNVMPLNLSFQKREKKKQTLLTQPIQKRTPKQMIWNEDNNKNRNEIEKRKKNIRKKAAQN